MVNVKNVTKGINSKLLWLLLLSAISGSRHYQPEVTVVTHGDITLHVSADVEN